jgi:hypothetical protein
MTLRQIEDHIDRENLLHGRSVDELLAISNELMIASGFKPAPPEADVNWKRDGF